MFDEFLQLDTLTLDEISNAAGHALDRKIYLDSLVKAKSEGNLFEVRRDNRLIAYSTLRDLENGNWFILMFVTHPEHRTRRVFLSLFSQITEHLNKNNAKRLVSNVLKNNEASIAFHKKLGFELTRENEMGYEFTLSLDNVRSSKWI